MDDLTATVTDEFNVETTTAEPAETPAPALDHAAVEATPDADAADLAADPGDEDDQLETKPQEQKPDKRSLQARIDKSVAAQREAERRAEAAERELERYRQPKQPEPVAARAEQPQYTRPKPTEGEIGAKYADYPAFIEDLADWKLEQRDAQHAIQAQRQAVAQRHEATAQKFSEKIQQAEQTDPQFWSKIAPHVANLRPSSALEPGERATAANAIADIIFDSDNSTELMAHFSANLKDFQRLSTLPPNLLFREMGRLEASLSRPAAATSGPAPTPISQAPPPIKPVGSTAHIAEPSEPTDDMDFDTFFKVGNMSEAKRKKGSLR